MSAETRPFEDAAQEREWQEQERALREERRAAGHGDDDLLVARYRVVARVLRDLPPGPLPADFADDVAYLAETAGDGTRLSAVEPLLTAFDRTLLAVLIILFAAATGIAVALCGVLPQISAMATHVLLLLANPWLSSLLGCLALSVGMRAVAGRFGGVGLVC